MRIIPLALLLTACGSGSGTPDGPTHPNPIPLPEAPGREYFVDNGGDLDCDAYTLDPSESYPYTATATGDVVCIPDPQTQTNLRWALYDLEHDNPADELAVTVEYVTRGIDAQFWVFEGWPDGFVTELEPVFNAEDRYLLCWEPVDPPALAECPE